MNVERVESCDANTLRQHIQAGKPFVFALPVRQWPALQKWTPDYLASVCDNREISVSYYPDADKYPSHVRLTVRQYLELLRSRPEASQQYYMETNTLAELSPDLYKDLPFPEFMNALPKKEDLIFFGMNTGSCCHLHPFHEAITFQLMGKKTFTLYHPRDIKNLYLEPFYGEYRRSRIDFQQIDFSRFPRAKRLQRIDVEMQAGDALYIPVQWPHWTLGQGLNFTLTRFFPASIWHYCFPQPGLKCLAGEFFHERVLPSWVGRKFVAPFLKA